MTRLNRLTDRLNLKEFQLQALLNITMAINDKLPKDELLTLYANIIHDELDIQRLLYFEKGEHGWRCARAVGGTGNGHEQEVAEYMGSHREIEFIASEHGQGIGAFDIAIPVFHKEQPLALLLIGDIDNEELRMSPTVKHLNFLQTITNLIAVALENKRLLKQALIEERNQRELELAAEMQQMLVPRKLPEEEELQAAAWYQPHHKVGGDYYDMIRTGPHQWMLCVADVSGKGIAAALVMANFQATLHALVKETSMPLRDMVRELNDNVMQRARGERFVTLFLGKVDLRQGTMEYVNAGHNPPMLRHGDGRLEELMNGSIALGMLGELPFVDLGQAGIKGGLLVCYTDGLVEQENDQGKDFGTEPIKHILQQRADVAPATINTLVVEAFERHRGEELFLDDIALLTCRFA